MQCHFYSILFVSSFIPHHFTHKNPLVDQLFLGTGTDEETTFTMSPPHEDTAAFRPTESVSYRRRMSMQIRGVSGYCFYL